jgi:hypothetical protein
LTPPPNAIADAIRKARTPLSQSKNAATLITSPLPGRVRGYRAYDYLTAADDGQTGRPRPVPDRAWVDALHHSDPDDAFAVSRAADIRDNLGVSVLGYEQAAAAGHPGAMINLGFLLVERWEPPDLPAAKACYEQAAAAGDTDAMYNLGLLLAERWEPPDLPAAKACYEQAAAAGHPSAPIELRNLAELGP